jgi:hypothetical protein
MEQGIAIIGASLLGALIVLFIAGTLVSLIREPDERSDSEPQDR